MYKLISIESGSIRSLSRYFLGLMQCETSADNNFTSLDENSRRAQSLTNAIAEMIILNLQSYSIINEEDSRDFVKNIESLYDIPFRTMITRNIVSQVY
jgi:hypothetical protein